MIEKLLKKIFFEFKFKSHFISSLSYKNFNDTFNHFSTMISLKPKEIAIPKRKKILVFAPHPDDEVFGPGGTLYLLRKTCRIKIIYVTSGRNEEEQILREKEANNLCDNFKFERHFLRHQQNFFSLNKNTESQIIKITRDYKPDIIFTPFFLDDNNDHQKVNKIFLKLNKFKRIKVWCYQIYSVIKGNYYVNITNYNIQKRKMIRFYKSENKVRNWESWVMSMNVINSRFMPRSKKISYAEMFLIFDIAFYRLVCKKFFIKKI